MGFTDEGSRIWGCDPVKRGHTPKSVIAHGDSKRTINGGSGVFCPAVGQKTLRPTLLRRY